MSMPMLFMAGILLQLTGCHSPRSAETGDSPTTGIEVISHYPVMQKQNNGVNLYPLDDTLKIIYQQGYELYCLSGTRVFETGEKVEGTERYFLHQEQDAFGYLFTASEPGLRTILTIDSFMNRYALGKMVAGPGQWDSLVFSDKDRGKDQFSETYIKRAGAPEGYFDSVQLVFDKKFYPKVRFSLSPKLDSMRTARLTSLRLIFKAGYSPLYQANLPYREFAFTIRELPFAETRSLAQLAKSWYEQKRDSGSIKK